MRHLALNEVHQVSGGEEITTTTSWESWSTGYDLDDVIDDISGMSLLGIGINIYLCQSFNSKVVVDGAWLGASVGAMYGLFNYVGYNYLANR